MRGRAEFEEVVVPLLAGPLLAVPLLAVLFVDMSLISIIVILDMQFWVYEDESV